MGFIKSTSYIFLRKCNTFLQNDKQLEQKNPGKMGDFGFFTNFANSLTIGHLRITRQDAARRQKRTLVCPRYKEKKQRGADL